MIATAVSRVNSKICLIKRIGNNKEFNFGPIFPSKVRSKCPAIILAVSRIVNVRGRIIFLIDSIQIINGINIIGVPWGTRWINIFFVLLIHPNNINLSQIGKAIVKFKTKCLVPVKIYGNNLIKLLIIIKINNLMKIKINLLLYLFLIIVENSLYNKFISL